MSDVPANTELGRRMRRLRTERHLTLKQVEEASGLSATHLSEVERGRTSPTVGALTRIAQALGRDTSFFVEQRELPEVSHQPREHVAGFLAGGARVEPLTQGVPGGRLFAYRLLVADAPFAAPPGEGEALYLVRSGRVEASFGGTRVALGPGDSAQARLEAPHALRPLEGAAEVLALFTRRIEEDGWPEGDR